jgi:hypothetical protein
MAAPGFDWAGAYVGANAGWWRGSPWTVGVQAGYNFVFNRVLVGIEGRFDYAGGFAPPMYVAAAGRVGFLIGDRALLYAQAEIGTAIGGLAGWGAGGGIEFGVGRSVSIFAESLVYGAFGGVCCGVSVVGGLNWHPGN